MYQAVVFTNGAIEKDGNVYIYYAASDTRLHVASTTVDKLSRLCILNSSRSRQKRSLRTAEM